MERWGRGKSAPSNRGKERGRIIHTLAKIKACAATFVIPSLVVGALQLCVCCCRFMCDLVLQIARVDSDLHSDSSFFKKKNLFDCSGTGDRRRYFTSSLRKLNDSVFVEKQQDVA